MQNPFLPPGVTQFDCDGPPNRGKPSDEALWKALTFDQYDQIDADFCESDALPDAVADADLNQPCDLTQKLREHRINAVRLLWDQGEIKLDPI